MEPPPSICHKSLCASRIRCSRSFQIPPYPRNAWHLPLASKTARLGMFSESLPDIAHPRTVLHTYPYLILGAEPPPHKCPLPGNRQTDHPPHELDADGRCHFLSSKSRQPLHWAHSNLPCKPLPLDILWLQQSHPSIACPSELLHPETSSPSEPKDLVRPLPNLSGR